MKRHNIDSNGENFNLYELYALKYIFEECAVFALLIIEGYKNSKFDFHIYPSGETAAINATRDLAYRLYNAKGFYPVKLNFKIKEIG